MMYNRMSHKFSVGEVLKNNNGFLYEVLAVDSYACLFERMSDGEKVLGFFPKMYEKTENGASEVVISWEYGHYYMPSCSIEYIMEKEGLVYVNNRI